jgi:predicted RNA-binding protein
VGRIIEDALSFPGHGEACFDVDLLGAYYGFDGPGELSLLDLLCEREEVAAARIDFDEDVIALELNPAFVSGMTMQMQ